MLRPITAPVIAACSPGTGAYASDAKYRKHLLVWTPLSPDVLQAIAARGESTDALQDTFRDDIYVRLERSRCKVGGQSTLLDAVRASMPKAQAKVDNPELRQLSGLGPPHWLGGGVSTSGANRGPLTEVTARPASYITPSSGSPTFSLNTARIASHARSSITSRRPICSGQSSTRRDASLYVYGTLARNLPVATDLHSPKTSQTTL